MLLKCMQKCYSHATLLQTAARPERRAGSAIFSDLGFGTPQAIP